ncbi:zf-HC2 domain-containing protein [Streptomyces stramineus]|uniref:Putative zinc-finger domain-containing protein n=1 Tax=Streptomyces stramineus TaxID=173861 RepID=A0ABP3KF12_9ACTN
MTGSGGQSPAEHHLGDRLAALVDGELGHDSRERVLAHLATCWTCKAEADAQRRLKSAFAEAAPPPLSADLLARLQSLPGTGPDDQAGRGAEGAEGVRGDAGRRGRGASGARTETFAPLPAVPGRHRERGFRTHDVHDPARGGSRSRRFAFAAAGAVSLAAFALGGAQPLASVVASPSTRAEDPRGTATPLSLHTGSAREDTLSLGFTAATRDAGPAVPGHGVSLLRPPTTPLLPPLIQAAARPAPPADLAR